MILSLKTIIKALIKKWYIVATVTLVFMTIGTAIGYNNYRKSEFISSSAYIFSNAGATATNIPISTHVNNCETYLRQDYIKYKVSDIIENQFGVIDNYRVKMITSSGIMTIEVVSSSEEIGLSVLNEYKEIITAQDNPIRQDNLVIKEIIEPFSREVRPSFNYVITLIILSGIIGLFSASIIVLYPLYSEKGKNDHN